MEGHIGGVEENCRGASTASGIDALLTVEKGVELAALPRARTEAALGAEQRRWKVG